MCIEYLERRKLEEVLPEGVAVQQERGINLTSGLH